MRSCCQAVSSACHSILPLLSHLALPERCLVTLLPSCSAIYLSGHLSICQNSPLFSCLTVRPLHYSATFAALCLTAPLFRRLFSRLFNQLFLLSGCFTHSSYLSVQPSIRSAVYPSFSYSAVSTSDHNAHSAVRPAALLLSYLFSRLPLYSAA